MLPKPKPRKPLRYTGQYPISCFKRKDFGARVRADERDIDITAPHRIAKQMKKNKFQHHSSEGCLSDTLIVRYFESEKEMYAHIASVRKNPAIYHSYIEIGAEVTELLNKFFKVKQ